MIWMKIKPYITISDHFTNLPDPRVERTKQHLLIDIITIAICAVICGSIAAFLQIPIQTK